MAFTIPCDTFFRLSKLAQLADNKTYSWIRSVALQRQAGRVVAMATNKYFMAVEFIGNEPGQPDDFALVSIEPQILQQCETERTFGGLLTVEKDNVLNYTKVSTTFGYVYSGNAGLFPLEDVPLKKWRNIIKPLPAKSEGCFYVDVDAMNALAQTSPSGRVIFPKTYDTREAVTIADAVSENWLGVFLARDQNGKQYVFNSYPDWATE